MSRPEFSAAYRRTAEVYRRRAAEVRAKASPKGRDLADAIARRWEATADRMAAQAAALDAETERTTCNES